MFSDEKLHLIFRKTSGHCHFCGDRLVFKRYGLKGKVGQKGVWEVDHVIQRGKGGSKGEENCLPACMNCNRLRWHRKGKDLRKVITLGLIATEQIKKKSAVGKEMVKLERHRKKSNVVRRRGMGKGL